MIPLKLLQKAMGQPPSATQGMIDYWRDQYRDYAKTTNALWDRLRPGFAQLPARTVVATPVAPAPATAKTVQQLDAELERLKREMGESFDDYIRDEKARDADRAAGWTGYPEWRKAQLEKEFFETKARLWAALMERTIAFLKRLEMVMREKEARIRAEIATEAAARAAVARRAAHADAGFPETIPVFWEELCILVKNLQIAEQERAALVSRGAPIAAVREAEANVAQSVKDLSDALRGRFTSLEAMGWWAAWCDQVKGVHFNWMLWIRPSLLLAQPVASTPPAGAPIPSYYQP